MEGKKEQGKRLDQKIERKNSKEKSKECGICFTELDTKQVASHHCGHKFHESCLEQMISTQVTLGTFPLKCPAGACGEQLRDSEVQEITISKIVSEKTIIEQKGFLDCPNPDCSEVCIKQDHGEEQRFHCVQCKRTYCLNCSVPWHENRSCTQFQELQGVREKERISGRLKPHQNSKCEAQVSKEEESDHMANKGSTGKPLQPLKSTRSNKVSLQHRR